MALQSHWKARVNLDFLEEVETKLKTSGPIKDRKIYSYFEAQKTP